MIRHKCLTIPTNGSSVTAHAEFIVYLVYYEMLAYYIRSFINDLLLTFGCVPGPHPRL